MTHLSIITPVVHVGVTIVPAPSIAPAIETRINQIWSEAVTEQPSLFDGTIVSVENVSDRGITGWVTSYRSFLAQRREPDLFAQLRVRPLAVSGILRCPDGLVVGCRAITTEQDRGCWELAPAGGVDAPTGSSKTLDLATQLLRELEEETGLRASDLEDDPKPWGILDDKAEHVVDVVFSLRTNLRREAIQAVFSASQREYDALAFLPICEVGPDLVGRWQFTAATAALMGAKTLL